MVVGHSRKLDGSCGVEKKRTLGYSVMSNYGGIDYTAHKHVIASRKSLTESARRKEIQGGLLHSFRRI